MALFNKTDPAAKRQRDLEATLKAKLINRDGLIERRKAAEASAAAYREKARRLAADSADDTALSTAETAMRREQDRAATFGDALGDVETAIVALEREIEEIIDRRCRAETAAAIGELIANWESAATGFEAAARQLETIARETAPIILDGHGLAAFAMGVRQEVPPAVNAIMVYLKEHAAAVLAGTAPASLPKPEVIEPSVAVEPPPPSQTLFALKNIKWRDAKNGRVQVGAQFEDVVLPLHLAERARRSGACVSVHDERRRALKGSRGGYHPRVDGVDIVDLDAIEDHSGVPYIGPDTADPGLRGANFMQIDRGPPRTGSISVVRL